jgi:ribosome modulation factor
VVDLYNPDDSRFRAGYWAFWRGRAPTECPFQEGTLSARFWIRGYMQAQQEKIQHDAEGKE